MSKYDIGIIGLWSGCNYGSIATYYALNQVVTSMGKSALMIDKPILKENDVELKDTHSRIFGKEHYNISEQYHLNELNKLNDLCDAFLIGSDQVWNYGISKNFGNYFYFDFVDEHKKKIAYAVSFGHGTDFASPEKRKEISKYMSHFDGISTREADGVRLCRDAYGIAATQVLDPVFLADPEIYKPLIDKSNHHEDEPFLATYILDPTPEKREAILHLAHELGDIKIVNMLDGLPWTFEKNKKLMNLPNCISQLKVEDWLYFISKCRYLITDSCHGASFGLIFKKDLVAITNRHRGVSRFKSLSELFGIENRVVSDPIKILSDKTLIEHMDYEKIEHKMQIERKRCYEWLEDKINQPKKSYDELEKQNVIEKIKAAKYNATPVLKKNSVMTTVINGSCSGCSVCESVCPKSAITISENAEGFLNPVVDVNKCVDCGICLKKCTSENPLYKNEANPKCFAMMADDDIRKISSSGGMFTVVAEKILEKSGYICGAAYRYDFTVEHIIIDKKEDLYKLRGSKYMQSHIGNIFKDVKALIDNDKTVLFTGMPCQVAGLYAFLGKNYYDSDKLYTIDLLCHGITSSKVFEKYHHDVLENKPLNRLEFKEKEPWGWHAGVNAYFTDGTKYSKPLETDPYFIAYLKSIAKNTNCEKCKANRLPRQADLTIGDFWGIVKNDPEMYDGKGTSVVLVNNPHGIQLFDECKSSMMKWKEEPLDIAIKGNRIIQAPYKLHKNRKAFFNNFDDLNFTSLTMGCLKNRLYEAQKLVLLKTVPEEDHEYYYLAKYAVERAGDRKIVTWANSPKFEAVLKKYFDREVAFSVVKNLAGVNNKTIFPLGNLRGRSLDYYVVAISPSYSSELYSILSQYGFNEFTDFIFRVHKPIVIENFDLSKERYEDEYGNTIEGYAGVIGKVVFRGGNNHIVLGDKIRHAENLSFDLSVNSYVEIGNECSINAPSRIVVVGLNGNSKFIVRDKCRFTDALVRIYNHERTSSILINELCTFESNLELHANSGKKIIIGRDCMFSHDIDLWAGDGHTVFDVTTGNNINSDYDNLPNNKNTLVIGEHVWIAKGAFIMHGTNIGNGSIVGAKSVVKGIFPNNCSIAGNPAKMIKKDVAWSRDMVATGISRCGKSKYVALTTLKNRIDESKIKNWFITGGSSGLGKEFVIKLLSLGYTVAATSRDISKLSDLPDEILKIQLDVCNFDSCKAAVDLAVEKMGRIDVIVNNAGVSHSSNFEETPNDIGENIIQTNFWGTANMIKAVLPHMRENKNGTVINISSASGFRARNYGSYYVASKFAVENLTKNLKFECQKFMRFMSIEIGGMNTGLMQRQKVIHTTIPEYKNLPPLFPYKKGYSNNVKRIVEEIIRVSNQEELPRDLILGWDAYQQFPQAIDLFEKETEKYKTISITTDESKKDIIKLDDITKPRNINNKIQNWLITGASGGFGKVLALRLVKLGYTVTVTSRDINRIKDLPSNIHKIESKLDHFEECQKTIFEAIKIMGSIDVLVNNATSNCWCSFEECDYEIMKNVFYVNYTLPQNMIKAILPHLRENKNGTVINITSIAGIQPRARVSTYSAAKAALEGLTRVLKSECQRFARFMAVELVCMRTGIMVHNPVIESQYDEYKGLGRYTQKINNIPNRKDIAAQQIINVVNQDVIPQSLLIGTESYLIAKNEIERARKDFEDYKDISTSICNKI